LRGSLKKWYFCAKNTDSFCHIFPSSRFSSHARISAQRVHHCNPRKALQYQPYISK
jgi:hypothetical protein